MKVYDVVVIGGGAAGFFTAINIAALTSGLNIAILERGSEGLGKVRISGGGRCNVTHAEFVPKPLAQNYPRGQRELLGPFHHFMTGDTMAWFEERGVPLKIEDDGRVFPVSDSSQSIIDCFLDEATRLGISIHYRESVKSFKAAGALWNITTIDRDFKTKKLVLATGSNTKIWGLLEALGHTYTLPVPSLFTFNCKDRRIEDLAGISSVAKINLLSHSGEPLIDEGNRPIDRGGSLGPLLITHWGFSGPAILKASAWAARVFASMDYRFKIRIDWLPYHEPHQVEQLLNQSRLENSKKTMVKSQPFELPKRLWERVVGAAGIGTEKRWADFNKVDRSKLIKELQASMYDINGKSTFKEEFVTSGGILLSEVNFKTFESKLLPHLYFAGEILDIDAVTGGFNFQNAWTGGFLVARAIAESSAKGIPH